jgi:hypothetical protein
MLHRYLGVFEHKCFIDKICHTQVYSSSVEDSDTNDNPDPGLIYISIVKGRDSTLAGILEVA